MGDFRTDHFSEGFPGSKVVYSTTESDTDETVDMNDTLVIPASRRNEKWLVIWQFGIEKRGSFPTADARALRADITFDGETFVNVRSNNTTGGSTKTGRGFQWSLPEHNFWHGFFHQYRVLELKPGVRSAQAIANVHDHTTNTGTPSELDNLALRPIRINSFNQFKYQEIKTGFTSSSDTWANSGFELTIEADGTTPILLGLSTSVHQFEGQTRFRFTKDGSAFGAPDDGTDFYSFGQSDQDTFIGGTNGSGDTDNDTLPVSLLWVDTPTAGEHTYRVQYRRNSGFTGANNAMWNTRDDGSDGFIGTFFLAELSFPTRQPA